MTTTESDTTPGKKYRCIIQIRLFNVATTALVDTGATNSAVNFSLLHCFPHYKKNVSRKSPKICVAVNNQQLKSLFTINAPITLEGGPLRNTKVIFQELEVIPNLIHPLIIGTDFLKAKCATIDFNSNEIRIEKITIKFEVPEWENSGTSHLVAYDDTVINPNSIAFLRTEIRNLDLRGRPRSMLIGPILGSNTNNDFMLTSYSVLDPFSEDLIVEVMNVTDKPLHVKRGRPVALIEQTDPIVKGMNMSRDLGKMPNRLEMEGKEDFCENSLKNLFPYEKMEKNGVISQNDVGDKRELPEPDSCQTLSSEILGLTCTDRPKGVLMKDGIKYLSLETKIDPEYKVDLSETVLDKDELEELESILAKYPNVMAKHADDVGRTDLAFHCTTLKSDIPVNARSYRTPPPKVREEIDRETDKLLAAGVIRESTSPYSAPIVLVKKPDNSWRYCTDFRALNKIIEKAEFPLPRITDSLRALKDPKVFSCLDLLKGYFQVEILESQKKYYAFSDGKRHLEYNRTPMGSRNSGATMARLMGIIFRGFPPEYLLSYLDDILLSTSCTKSHLALLDRVLAALNRAGLKLNPKKCKIARNSVRTLGFVLSSEGITADPSNLSKVRDWPTPKCVKNVRQFLGLASYYRSHIVNFARKARVLTDLLAKDKEWEWGHSRH